MAAADALSGYVLGELARAPAMTGGKAAGGGMAHHALLDVQISSTLHLKLAALKVPTPPAPLCRLLSCSEQASDA